MPVVHVLNPIVENFNNYSNYRFEGSCSCGFSTKLSTKVAVEDQLANHLQYHGVKVQTLADKQQLEAQKAREWKPAGLK